MLSNSTPDSDSDASVAASDPFAVNGKALFNESRQEGPMLAAKPSGSHQKQTPVKKTFQITKKLVHRSNMPPPAIPALNGVSLAPPKVPSHAAFKDLPAAAAPFRLPNLAPVQAPVDSSGAALHDDVSLDVPRKVKARDQVMTNETNKLEGQDAIPNHFQEAHDNRMNHGFDDPRPSKRRKILTEKDQNEQTSGIVENSRESTPHPENTQYVPETPVQPTEGRPNNGNATTHVPSNVVKSFSAAAFQSYMKEHSIVLESWKAHWANCSLDAWMAGGEEITEKFAKVLTKGIAIFEAEMDGFGEIEQKFEEYKKDVLDNQDLVLRQARETITEACSMFIPGRSGNKGTTS